MGIGTLIVFIAMVLVAAIAAGVLINTAGFLQSQAQQTGEQSSEQVSNRLQPVAITGDVNASSDGINSITLVVKKAPGSSSIDLENVTASYIGPNADTRLVNASVAGPSQAEFTVDELKDADGSFPVLNSPDDRMVVTITLANKPKNPAPLDTGDTVELTLTTQSGSSTTIFLEVPST
ncbi:MAG: archaellin/type IV pilin N-terminal domain-containing protein, partial [Halobacteriaceae archaeon]